MTSELIAKFGSRKTAQPIPQKMLQNDVKKLEENIKTMSRDLLTASENYHKLVKHYEESVKNKTNQDFVQRFSKESPFLKDKINNLNAELVSLKSSYNGYEEENPDLRQLKNTRT